MNSGTLRRERGNHLKKKASYFSLPQLLIYLFMSGIDWMPVYDAYIESFDRLSLSFFFLAYLERIANRQY